jgi:cytochrome c oxidase cbb3-type subunit III
MTVHQCLAAAALVAGLTGSGCQRGETGVLGVQFASAARAASGTVQVPAVAASGLLELRGRMMGPQPGPDRPIGEHSNPFEQQSNVLADGRRLFLWFNCYGCHGGRAGGGMGPSLRDGEWMYGSKDQDVFNSIAEGRPHGMPAWGTKLPVEELWKLTAYIKSLDSPREPDPPPKNPVLPDLASGGGHE